jgi:prophage regulatory protein
MATTILRLPQVLAQCGLARSTLYGRIAEGLWTAPVSLGPRSVGWPDSEIDAINSARIAGKSDDEIRALVAKLKQQRTVAA